MGNIPAGRLARRISLRQLQVFEAIVRLGSFTRAAEELFLTQPTVSMQTKKLADVMGLELFVGLIQALIFSMLTLIFGVMAVTAHHPEEHHEEGH